MHLRSARILGFLALAVAGIASRSYADPITLPVGLAPGSQYRLVFVTEEFYNANDSNIADYNNEVNTEANGVAALAALGTTWLDIGSTSTVNAIDNIGQDTGVPIYNLDGQLVADDATSSGLFAGSIQNPIDYNESGNLVGSNYLVWTGTRPNGTDFDPLGAGGGLSEQGEANDASNIWIGLGDQFNTESFALYGISGILTVPGSNTPEPSTIVMASLGGAILLIALRRKKSSSPRESTTTRNYGYSS